MTVDRQSPWRGRNHIQEAFLEGTASSWGRQARLQQAAMGGGLPRGCDCCSPRAQQGPRPPPEAGPGLPSVVWALRRLARTREGVRVISPGPAAARWGRLVSCVECREGPGQAASPRGAPGQSRPRAPCLSAPLGPGASPSGESQVHAGRGPEGGSHLHKLSSSSPSPRKLLAALRIGCRRALSCACLQRRGPRSSRERLSPPASPSGKNWPCLCCPSPRRGGVPREGCLVGF